MPAVPYPSSLPLALVTKTREQPSAFAMSQPRRGLGYVEPVGTIVPAVWALTWRLTTAQAQEFWAWFNDDLARGELAFDMLVGTEWGNVEQTLQLLPGSLMPARPLGAGGWEVSASAIAASPKLPGAICLAADPHINSVVLLLRGQGADGGTTITDSSAPSSPLVGSFNPPDSVTGVTTSSAQFLECFGATSLLFAAAGSPGLRYASANALAYIGNVIAGGGYTSWTMDAWVRQSSSGVMALLSYRPPTTIGWAWTTTGWRAHIGGVWSDTWISVSSPAAETWTHVQMERDGSAWRYFTNGVLVGSFTNSGAITTNAAQVAVGHGSTSTTEQQFRGHMYLRFTVGVARSGGSAFTPPNNFPAV